MLSMADLHFCHNLLPLTSILHPVRRFIPVRRAKVYAQSHQHHCRYTSRSIMHRGVPLTSLPVVLSQLLRQARVSSQVLPLLLYMQSTQAHPNRARTGSMQMIGVIFHMDLHSAMLLSQGQIQDTSAGLALLPLNRCGTHLPRHGQIPYRHSIQHHRH